MHKSETPLISIIIPLYNKEKFIRRSLESVFSQSYSNIEIVVVNDGSTDGSREIVLSMDDPRIRLIDKPNGGVSSARNRGIDEAKGVYIAFLDADDVWREKHLEVLMEGFHLYPDAAIVANALEYRWEEGDKHSNINHNGIPKWKEENYLHSLSQGSFPIHIGSCIFKKELLNRHQIRFYEHMRLSEDVNLMLRVSRLGRVVRSNYTGLIYYQDDLQSAMKQKEMNAALVPHYFEGMQSEKWSEQEEVQVRRFLLREYLKKAYQNRHLSFIKKELSPPSAGGNIAAPRWAVIAYIFIRFTPEFVYRLYKRVK